MVVNLKGLKFEDSRFEDGSGGIYSAVRLVERTKDLPVFDLPLAHIDISIKIFGKPAETARGLAEHIKRTNETNLDYPVIMDADGFIMDGWHRVVKALVEGRETIKAVRFEETPPPDYYKKEDK